MYNNDTRELTNFLTIVQKGIRKHGIKKIVKIIQSIDLQENNMFYNEIFSFIIESVAHEFNITIDDLIEAKKRGDVTIARKIAIVLAKEHIDISDEILAKEFNRVRQVVYHILIEFNNYDREDKFCKEFFEKYDKINEKVVKHIEFLKNE